MKTSIFSVKTRTLNIFIELTMVYHCDMKVINKVLLMLGVLALGMNQFIEGLYEGFAYGASKMCNYSYAALGTNEARIWISGADPYFNIHNWYVYISLILVLFIASKLVDDGLVSNLISFILLVFSLTFFFKIERSKQLEINNPDKYIDLMRETSQYSSILLSLLIGLAATHIVLFLINFSRWRRAMPKDLA